SLLFLLIGIEAAPYLIHDYWFYVIIIFIASILVRLLVVSATIKLFSKMDHIDLKQYIIIACSGIKGTMSIFLLLKLSINLDSNLESILKIGLHLLCYLEVFKVLVSILYQDG